MPPTIKQENFCQAYIETGNASAAYRRTYNAEAMKSETVNRTAKELLDNPKITPRLEELHQASRQRHEITVDSLTLELETARIMAIEGDRPSAAVAATMGKAKLHGLLIDKQEDVTSRTRDELIARATELLHKRGIGLTTS